MLTEFCSFEPRLAKKERAFEKIPKQLPFTKKGLCHTVPNSYLEVHYEKVDRGGILENMNEL